MASVKVGIKSGPNRFALMLALFDRTPEAPRPVSFTLKSVKDSDWWVENQKLTLHITSVSLESGGGDSWIFEGYSDEGVFHKGYYHTGTREGTVEVEDISVERLAAHERMGTRDLLEDLKRKYRPWQ